MSDLQDEMVKILREHENGLSVEEIQSQLQQRSSLNARSNQMWLRVGHPLRRYRH